MHQNTGVTLTPGSFRSDHKASAEVSVGLKSRDSGRGHVQKDPPFYLLCFTLHTDFCCMSESDLDFPYSRSQPLVSVVGLICSGFGESSEYRLSDIYLRNQPTITFNAIKLAIKIKIHATKKC